MRPWSPWLFLLVVMVLAAPLHAAEAFEPGSWSVQFSVEPNFTLGSFKGSTLSLKRHLSRGRAIRLGLSVNVTDQESDQSLAVIDSTVLFSSTFDVDSNNWTVGMSAQYFWYSDAAAPVHVYWGGGPFANLSGGETDQVNTTGGLGGTSVRNLHQDLDGWGAGLAAALGVEWQVAKRVGIFAEYESSVGYFTSEENRSSIQTLPPSPAPRGEEATSESHRVQFSGSGGRLGVSAYF